MNDTITRFGSGQSVLRIEDDKLLKGLGRFTDDLTDDSSYPQHLILCFVRSPYPHARIVSVDTSAAIAMPGVAAVVTGADLVAAGVKPLPGTVGFKRADGSPGVTAARRPLAHERVRYVGEAVAMVAASTLQQARDAAEAVLVDYEELPMVVTLEQALASGAPIVCDEAPDNIAAEARHGKAPQAAEAFARAAHVVTLDIANQRMAALTLEPRSILALIDPSDGRLIVRMSSQMPSGVKNTLHIVLGVPADQRFRHERRNASRRRGGGLVRVDTETTGQMDLRAQ